MSDKIAIMLRQPDRVTVTYGDKDITLDWPDFHETVFLVEETNISDLEPYMAEGEDERKHD